MTSPVPVGIILSDGLESKGGIGRIVGYLVTALAQRAPDIEPRVYRARWREHGIARHLTIPPALAAFAWDAARRRIRVAHINVAPRGSTTRKSLFAAVAQRLGVPVILHLHGSGYDDFFAAQSPARRARIARFFASAARVVALSDRWAGFVRDELGVPAARVVVIGNGVPAPPVADARPTADGTAPPHLLFVGLVGERKGVDVLLAALAQQAARGIAWRATIAGNGDIDAARAAATAYGIADRIAFPGWVDEDAVRALMRTADLFVLPSRAENQPIAILEAMAAALPVVATTVGAIPEQVVDGDTALLVPPANADRLAEALARLLPDAALRRRMGAAGRARFAAHFAIDGTADRFAALYRELAGAAD